MKVSINSVERELSSLSWKHAKKGDIIVSRGGFVYLILKVNGKNVKPSDKNSIHAKEERERVQIEGVRVTNTYIHSSPSLFLSPNKFRQGVVELKEFSVFQGEKEFFQGMEWKG